LHSSSPLVLSAPILSIRERGFRSAQAAAAAFEAAEFKNASCFAEAAIADFLFLLAYFRRGRAQQIPDEILKHLVNQGISDHEEQRDAIQKAREGMLFPAMNLSLQILYCCAMDNRDAEGATEAVELYLPLARQIADSSPGDTSIALNLALALMAGVGAIAAFQDGKRLQQATINLKETEQILDANGDKPCQDDGWIRIHRPQIEKSLQALSDWVSAANNEGDSMLESNLYPIHSKFKNVAEQMQGIITLSKTVKSCEEKKSAKNQA